MSFTKGGRGKQAPYSTTHVRVPTPLKTEIDNIIREYKEMVEAGLISPETEVKDLYSILNVNYKTVGEAMQEAKRILKQKKGAKYSLVKLVNTLYNSCFDVDDLDK